MRSPRFLMLVVTLALAGAFALLRPAGGRADPPRRPAGARHVHHRLALGERVVKFARHLLGVPYRWGGTSPSSGFDCSGFVRYVYGHFGVSLPHSSFADFGLGRRIVYSAMRPGDLVFFDGAGHVGIYVGHGRFIHAPHTGTRVSISPLAGRALDGARRVS